MRQVRSSRVNSSDLNITTKSHAVSLENEILLRDGGGISNSSEQDRLIWIAVDGNQRIRADISDRHAIPEVVGGDPEGRDIQEILAARGFGIEVLNPIIAKPWREDELVRAAAAV